MPQDFSRLIIALLFCAFANVSVVGKTPVEYANPLVARLRWMIRSYWGTLRRRARRLTPGLPFLAGIAASRILLGPINKDLSEAADNHGIIFPYIQFASDDGWFFRPLPGLTIMPVVGNWTVPPDRSYASPYDKAAEKASPGYYSVFFPIAASSPS